MLLCLYDSYGVSQPNRETFIIRPTRHAQQIWLSVHVLHVNLFHFSQNIGFLRNSTRVWPTDGRTEGPTDGRTDIPSYRFARTHLKNGGGAGGGGWGEGGFFSIFSSFFLSDHSPLGGKNQPRTEVDVTRGIRSWFGTPWAMFSW